MDFNRVLRKINRQQFCGFCLLYEVQVSEGTKFRGGCGKISCTFKAIYYNKLWYALIVRCTVRDPEIDCSTGNGSSAGAFLLRINMEVLEIKMPNPTVLWR